MNAEIQSYIEKYPVQIREMFVRMRALLPEAANGDIEEKLWARLPSYYRGEKFVRLIPFKDHINVEALATLAHREELSGYKITPKGMLQIFADQALPTDALTRIFRETLI